MHGTSLGSPHKASPPHSPGATRADSKEFSSVHSVSSCWKKGLAGVVAVLLLAPLSGFANITLGTWSFVDGGNGANPFGWSNPVGSGTGGLTLDFQILPNSTPLAAQTVVQMQSTITDHAAPHTVSLTAISGFSNLTMTAGKVTIELQVFDTYGTGSVQGDINVVSPPTGNNQFTGTVSDNLRTTTPNTISISPSSHKYVLNIIYTFSANSTWTATSSSSHVVFSN